MMAIIENFLKVWREIHWAQEKTEFGGDKMINKAET